MTVKRTMLGLYFLLRLPMILAARLLGGIFVRRPGNKVDRILLIRLDRIGDLVLTLPVIESLRRYYRDAKISVLVRPYMADLARMVGAIDEVIVYDNFMSTAGRLRREKFSVAIDMLCDYTLRPALIALFSGAGTRIGFDEGFRGLLFTDTIKDPLRRPRHMVDINLDVLGPLGVPIADTTPHIALPADGLKRDNIVVMHPGGHYESQRWPAERFAALAENIAKAYDVDVVVVGAPGDKALTEEVMSRLDRDNVRAVSTDLKELVQIVAGAALLISNNSGPLHLAAALGIPTVSTMGPTDPVLWWPRGQNQHVIRKALRCSPCGVGACQKHSCMDLITVDEMFKEAKNILDGIDGVRKH